MAFSITTSLNDGIILEHLPSHHIISFSQPKHNDPKLGSIDLVKKCVFMIGVVVKWMFSYDSKYKVPDVLLSKLHRGCASD